jgi:MFS transporter, FHS family, glucose/mannose:H+ symporter
LAIQTAEPQAQPARSLASSHIWLLTVGGFFAFFVFGFVDNLKGPTLPALLRDVNLSYGEGGAILLSAYIGFMVATILTGVLADAAGLRVVLLLAGVALTIGLTAFSLVSSFWLLALALFVVGLGLGSIEVGGNGMIVDLHSANRARYLNLLAVFHGVGSLVVPIYAAQMLSAAFTWRQVYQFAIILAVGMVLFFALVRYPPALRTGGEKLSLRTMFSAGLTWHMGWYYLLITAYVAAEIGIAAWIVEYLQQVKGFDIGTSSLYLSLFFAAIMIGRLVGSFVVDRIGYLAVMLTAIVASIVTLGLGIFGPPALVFLIPLTGIFFSIMFPTTTASVSSLHVTNMGAILGVLFAFGGLGGALGPWLIGAAADLVGIELAFAMNIGFCVLTLVALLALRIIARKNAPSAAR